MAVTLKQQEDAPASYPEITEGLIPIRDLYGQEVPADAESLSWVWQRIEAYCAHRWTPRNVIWIIEGEGYWEAPLTPATVGTVEKWEGGGWVESNPPASPFGGFDFPSDGPHRVTASVGGGDVPPAVMKAATRLANYLSQQIDPNDPDLWATSMKSVTKPETTENGTPHETEEAYSRPATYIARALQYSGAADLLRPYRRA